MKQRAKGIETAAVEVRKGTPFGEQRGVPGLRQHIDRRTAALNAPSPAPARRRSRRLRFFNKAPVIRAIMFGDGLYLLHGL